VKLPNGVAGIKGTIYECFAEGIIKIREGSAVVSYSGANGASASQVIMGLQMFDIRTGTLSALPDTDKTGIDILMKAMQAGLVTPQTPGVNRGLIPPEVPVVPIQHVPVQVQQNVPPPVSGF
jgi:hypothetical protein